MQIHEHYNQCNYAPNSGTEKRMVPTIEIGSGKTFFELELKSSKKTSCDGTTSIINTRETR